LPLTKLKGFFGGTVVTILDIGPFLAQGDVLGGVGSLLQQKITDEKLFRISSLAS